MRKLILGLALVLVLSLIAGVACGGSSPPAPSPSPTPTPSPPVSTPTPTSTSSASMFTIDHPEDWTWSDELVVETEDAVAAYRSPTEEDSFRSYMTVTKRGLPIPLSVREVFGYAESTGHMATAFPGYVSVSDEDITVAGLPAINHVFTYGDEALKLKAKRLWIVKERETWVVTCVTAEAAFDSWKPALDGIVLSFIFL